MFIQVTPEGRCVTERAELYHHYIITFILKIVVRATNRDIRVFPSRSWHATVLNRYAEGWASARLSFLFIIKKKHRGKWCHKCMIC